jgi:hypothetical protein
MLGNNQVLTVVRAKAEFHSMNDFERLARFLPVLSILGLSGRFASTGHFAQDDPG